MPASRYTQETQRFQIQFPTARRVPPGGFLDVQGGLLGPPGPFLAPFLAPVEVQDDFVSMQAPERQHVFWKSVPRMRKNIRLYLVRPIPRWGVPKAGFPWGTPTHFPTLCYHSPFAARSHLGRPAANQSAHLPQLRQLACLQPCRPQAAPSDGP